MNRKVSPAVFAIVIVVVLAIVAVWGFKMFRPAPYKMSPGGGPRALTSSGGAPSPTSGGTPISGGAPMSGGFQPYRGAGSPTSAGSPPPGAPVSPTQGGR
jgi:hypothetical protein